MNFLDEIREASRDGLVVCFNGVGSAFARKNSHTSLIVAKSGQALLVDCGSGVPVALAEKQIRLTDFDGYYLTHSHSDHIGGVEELLLSSRYVTRKKPQMLIAEPFERLLWEHSLKGGCGFNELGPLSFSDLVQPVHPRWVRDRPRTLLQTRFLGMDILLFRTFHVPVNTLASGQTFWSTGLLVDGQVLFTADTRFDQSLFKDIEMGSVKAIFHDCQLAEPGTVHATYRELKTLPPALRHKMWLTHYEDSFEQYHPEEDGFCGFAQAWRLYQF